MEVRRGAGPRFHPDPLFRAMPCRRTWPYRPGEHVTVYGHGQLGVHVSNILRKLGVSGRVQAAALAERAGLLPSGQP